MIDKIPIKINTDEIMSIYEDILRRVIFPNKIPTTLTVLYMSLFCYFYGNDASLDWSSLCKKINQYCTDLSINMTVFKSRIIWLIYCFNN